MLEIQLKPNLGMMYPLIIWSLYINRASRSKPYLAIAWYLPPSDPVGSFDKLEKTLAYLDREGEEMILLGYTNCDFTKIKSDQIIDNNGKHMANVYRLFNLVQLVEKPTRVTLETATIIDHIARTCTRNIIKVGVREVILSDHYIVYCIRKCNGEVETDHKKIETWNMKHFSENQFLCDVSDICWGQFFHQTDGIDILVKNWSSLFSFVIEKHALLKEIRVSERYCP